MFTNTIDNGAKLKAQYKHTQKTPTTGHLDDGKYLCKNLGIKD